MKSSLLCLSLVALMPLAAQAGNVSVENDNGCTAFVDSVEIVNTVLRWGSMDYAQINAASLRLNIKVDPAASGKLDFLRGEMAVDGVQKRKDLFDATPYITRWGWSGCGCGCGWRYGRGYRYKFRENYGSEPYSSELHGAFKVVNLGYGNLIVDIPLTFVTPVNRPEHAQNKALLGQFDYEWKGALALEFMVRGKPGETKLLYIYPSSQTLSQLGEVPAFTLSREILQGLPPMGQKLSTELGVARQFNPNECTIN